MFYPQGNFYSQGNLGYPQGNLGYPQGGFGHQAFQGIPSFQGTPNGIPSANALYGYPQVTPNFAQSPLNAFANAGLTNGATQSVGGWQPQQSIGGWQQPQVGPQFGPEQINPALIQQSQQHLLQRLAQYHYWVAQQLTQLAAQQFSQQQLTQQQLTQLAAQQAGQIAGNPFTGQFIPSPLGAAFVPGITMH